MKKRVLALVALLVMLPGAALAQVTVYNLNGNFAAPATGTYSGTFSYDAGTSTVTSAVFNVSAGLTDAGAARTAATYSNIATGNANFLLVSNAPFAVGNRLIGFNISPNLNSPTPGVTLGADGQCLNAACTSGSVVSTVQLPVTFAVAAVAVPTMTEWAMILFALILAGGAALMIQRQRLAA